MIRATLAAAMTLVAMAVTAPFAQATFPGRPGPVAFERAVDPRNEDSLEIFRVARPGAQPRRLTRGNGSAHTPDYSPDGRRIAFERRFGGRSPDAIWIMGANGFSARALPTPCVADPCLGTSSPGWAPDGTQLVFERAFGPIVDDAASGLDLMTANADGTNERVILHMRSLEPPGQEPHDAQWSPDGSRIAVNILNITARPRNGSAIYVLNADGTGLRRITPLRLNAGNPDWSPDGSRIVFNSSYEGQGKVELYTVRPDGSGLQRIRREPRRSFSFQPVWSPNGRRIAFVHATARTIPHIWTIRPNGRGLRRLTGGPKPDFAPDWGVR